MSHPGTCDRSVTAYDRPVTCTYLLLLLSVYRIEDDRVDGR